MRKDYESKSKDWKEILKSPFKKIGKGQDYKILNNKQQRKSK
jgi:hypothetical protein